MNYIKVKGSNEKEVPRHQKPVTNYKPDHSKGWAFSFKYLKQIDYFGLKDQNPNWFVSLLERLQDVSTKSIEFFVSNRKEKDDYRYHAINWNATNIPIKRADLNWIDKDILNNDEEFPFYQFQISKANGRIVGFWDVEQTVFHIVLLDPKHNIQPSKNFEYKVDDTNLLPCKYTSLLAEIDRVKSKKCFCEKCTFKNELVLLQDKFNTGNFVYFQLEDQYYKEFKARTKDKSVSELIELWLLSG